MTLYRLSILAMLLAVNPALAFAQQVPAIENTDFQPTYPTYATVKAYAPLQPLSPDTIRLNTKEQNAVNLSAQWTNKTVTPVLQENGAISFPYGETMPSVVCPPLHACDIAFQPGEIVQQVDLGDNRHWKAAPAKSGSGDKIITHLIIKASDAGLKSNIVVNTDKRTYNIRLVSKKDGWTPLVSFTYPDDTDAAWTAYRENYALPALRARTVRQEVGEALLPANLNFNFRIKGDHPLWKPIRVYSDESKTYIQFPAATQKASIPALVILGTDNREQLVNYRLVGHRYVVDALIQKAALISGVGHHRVRVIIEREDG